MKTAIIVSKKDLAGMNIKGSLINNFNFKKNNEKFDDNDIYELNGNVRLYTVDKESIYNEDIDKKINADLFIFATKHQSAKGIHSLSCHSPGNWSRAEAGGKDKKLCVAPAVLLKEAFIELNNLGKDLHHEITLEVTHHGPYLEKPCFFIEIGSDKDNWKNKKAGEVIARVIINLLKNINDIMENKNNYKVAFGIGGLHYALSFNKRLVDTDIAIGHICPKYQLENLDKEMIIQAIDKTFEKVDFILLDWKGLGKEKQRIVELLKGLKIEYRRTDKV